MGHIDLGENLAVMRSLPTDYAQLIYIDPPFNTGKAQTRTRVRTVRDEGGDRAGFRTCCLDPETSPPSG